MIKRRKGQVEWVWWVRVGDGPSLMGQWSVGQWIVAVITSQKIYGLYGLRHVTKVKR